MVKHKVNQAGEGFSQYVKAAAQRGKNISFITYSVYDGDALKALKKPCLKYVTIW